LRHTRRALAAQQPRGVGSLDVVHRDPQLALIFAAIVDPDDVLVVQARGQLGLTVKALAEFEIRADIGGQDFQGIAAGQSRMPAKYTCPIPPAPSGRMMVYPANISPSLRPSGCGM
jgi:hypothetical protein